jgi:hypothetical protein
MLKVAPVEGRDLTIAQTIRTLRKNPFNFDLDSGLGDEPAKD